MSLTKDVIEARELLIQLTDLYQSPKVRSDPVVKSLMQGMTPKVSEFAQASLAVSTLRNAGMFEQSTGNNSSVVSGGPKDQPKPEKEKKIIKDKSEKPQKLRGYSRAVDLIIEDDMATGTYPNGDGVHEDKKHHMLAATLNKLRANPDREIEVKVIKGIYESGTYPNGKTYNKFQRFDIGKENGKPVFQFDEKLSGPRKVKDLSDWDLLALEAPNWFDDGALLGGRQGGIAKAAKGLFSWAEGKRTLLNPLGTASIADIEKTWPSLKGTPLVEMIKSFDGPPSEEKRTTMIKELSQLPWAQFGPSTTVWWKGKPLTGGALERK